MEEKAYFKWDEFRMNNGMITENMPGVEQWNFEMEKEKKIKVYVNEMKKNYRNYIVKDR